MTKYARKLKEKIKKIYSEDTKIHISKGSWKVGSS